MASSTGNARRWSAILWGFGVMLQRNEDPQAYLSIGSYTRGSGTPSEFISIVVLRRERW